MTLVPAATTLSPDVVVVTLADLGVSGNASVAVYDLDTESTLTAGTGDFETASIVKVDILVALLLKQDGSLTTSQKTLAKSMITLSDNSAATTLFQTVGGATGLNKLNLELGLVETTAGSNGNWGLTTTTAQDQIRLLKLIFLENDIISDASRAYVSSLMSAVSQDQDWGVTAAASNDETTAVKNGWLQRTTTGLWDVTSIGYVEYQEHSLLAVVLVTSSKSMSAGVNLVEDAASAAVELIVET